MYNNVPMEQPCALQINNHLDLNIDIVTFRNIKSNKHHTDIKKKKKKNAPGSKKSAPARPWYGVTGREYEDVQLPNRRPRRTMYSRLA